MKDPIILCQNCLKPGRHVRKKAGVRCANQQCSIFGSLLATELQVQVLKQQLKHLAASQQEWGRFKGWLDTLQEGVVL